MNNEYILKLLKKYLEVFDKEKDEFSILNSHLKENSESIVSRSNREGHVTSSGIVLDKGNILLIFHNKLNKYIQPGGHIEDETSLWESAKREVEEETGLKIDLNSWHVANNFIPLHIDTHKIPFNEKKNEPEHYHHDFTFVFNLLNENIKLQAEEVSGYKWVPIIEDSFDEKLLKNVCLKLNSLKLNS